MFTKIPQAWVPPMYLPRVLALLAEYMNNDDGDQNNPPIEGWELMDDRGNSSMYIISFNQDKPPGIATIKRIVGRRIDVTMEHL